MIYFGRVGQFDCRYYDLWQISLQRKLEQNLEIIYLLIKQIQNIIYPSHSRPTVWQDSGVMTDMVLDVFLNRLCIQIEFTEEFKKQTKKLIYLKMESIFKNEQRNQTSLKQYLNFSFLFFSMATVTLMRVYELDKLNGQKQTNELLAIMSLLHRATIDQIQRIEMHLIFYDGKFKQAFSDIISERKLSLNLQKQKYEVSQLYTYQRQSAYRFKYYLMIGLYYILCLSVALLVIKQQLILVNGLLLCALVGMVLLIWSYGCYGYKGLINKDLDKIQQMCRLYEDRLLAIR